MVDRKNSPSEQTAWIVRVPLRLPIQVPPHRARYPPLAEKARPVRQWVLVVCGNICSPEKVHLLQGKCQLAFHG